MIKRIIPVLLAAFMVISFIGCTGKGVLSQKAMDEKIGQLTEAGKKELKPTLESACDQKFEMLVQSYTDSLLTAAKGQ